MDDRDIVSMERLFRRLLSGKVNLDELYLHLEHKYSLFTANDTTPSVAGGNTFKTQNDTSPRTITMFDDGYIGQQIMVIIGDAYTVIDFTGTHLKGNGGSDWSPAANDHMTCVFDGTNWYCDVSDNT